MNDEIEPICKELGKDKLLTRRLGGFIQKLLSVKTYPFFSRSAIKSYWQENTRYMR